MTMTYDKALDRVKKLLALAEGAGSEAEAANAAEKAAALIAEYQLTEAELRLASGEDKSKEPIVDRALDPRIKSKRVAWESTIAAAVARSYGCRYYWYGGTVYFFGRESSVQAAIYTTQYLRAEVERLCAEAWLREREAELSDAAWNGRDARGAARAWKNGFRLGAASEVARRLYTAASDRRDTARQAAQEAAAARAARGAPAGNALAVIERDKEEVDAAYAKRSKGFGKGGSLGATSSLDGYARGRQAGGQVSLGGGRAGLSAGQGRLKGGA